MASKRSQVRSNLQTITANQPVARVIDTYAPSAALLRERQILQIF